MQKIIWVDIDDTLCETYSHMAEEIRNRFNVDFQYEHITDYYLRGIPQIETIECNWLDFYIETFQKRKGHFLTIEWSVNAIKNLKNIGYSFVAITARGPETYAHSKEWLEKHYSNNIETLVHLWDGSGKMVSKAATCKNYNAVCMIEDHIDHCLDLAHNDIKSFLLERPWNRHRTETHPLITKVKSWEEITKKLAND